MTITLQTPMAGRVDCSPASIVAAIRDYPRGSPAYSTDQVNAFAAAHIKWAGIFGRRASVVVAQTLHETGYLRFGGDVKPDQFNFGGLGAVGGGAAGASFDDIDQGVCAVYVHHMVYEFGTVGSWPAATRQYQHLDARYAEVLSAGYGGVVRVIADFTNGRWAHTKTIPVGSLKNGYAQAMVDGANALLAREGGDTMAPQIPTAADIGYPVSVEWADADVGPARSVASVRWFVVHKTQGQRAGDLQILVHADKAQASVHFWISLGGEVVYIVPIDHVAWAVANQAVDAVAINVELEGFTADKTPEPQYRALAAVFRWCRAHGMTVPPEYVGKAERPGIIGHQDVADPNHPGRWGGASNHTDPGPLFDWAHLVATINGATPAAPAAPDVRTDPVTGFKIIGGIRAFYEDLERRLGPGDALLLIGRPLNDEHPSGDATAQDFERARLEWRKGQRPDRWDIVLGLVNSELIAAQAALAKLKDAG